MQSQGYHPNNPVHRRDSSQRPKKKLLMMLAAIFCGLTVGMILLYPSLHDERRTAFDASRNTFIDNIYVDGTSLAGLTYEQALSLLSARARKWENSWTLQVACAGHTYATLDYPAIGMMIDIQQLTAVLDDAWIYGHAGGFAQFCKDTQQLAQTPFRGTLSQVQSGSEQLDYLLQVIQDNISREPQDAALPVFDPMNPAAPFVFTHEKLGRTIDVQAAKEDILRLALTGEGGVYDIPVVDVSPMITTASLQESYSLLAHATTAIDKHSTTERDSNIALAFERLNGTILKNGESMSFNKLVGKRSLANGFKMALGYVSGELAETVGGGVCQASTTLYSAAVCAGMTIRSRTPHSIPVSYISLGQDATVNDTRGHEIDLLFKNETGHTVYITCGLETTSAGRKQCAVYIYGHALPSGEYSRLESVIEQVLPVPEDVVRKDKEAKYVTYSDQRYKYSSGAEGYVVKTYLQRLKEGNVLEQQLISTDTYRARGAVYYVGLQERVSD